MLTQVKQRIRNTLYGTPLFEPLRDGYQYLFDPGKREFRNRAHRFYAPFVKNGALVFDVGAYIGDYAQLFTELGAQVVAIEPNPRNCESLQRLARARNVHVENCALADVPGKLALHICNENPKISTLSDEWFEAAQHSPAHSKNTWFPAVAVDVVTLNHVASKYGMPDFVKIDVEGFDDKVLAGMSFQPAALSFEYNLEIPHVALNCLERLVRAYEFNFVRGMKMELANELWVGAEELVEQLQLCCPPSGAFYGDVLARRVR